MNTLQFLRVLENNCYTCLLCLMQTMWIWVPQNSSLVLLSSNAYNLAESGCCTRLYPKCTRQLYALTFYGVISLHTHTMANSLVFLRRQIFWIFFLAPDPAMLNTNSDMDNRQNVKTVRSVEKHQKLFQRIWKSSVCVMQHKKLQRTCTCMFVFDISTYNGIWQKGCLSFDACSCRLFRQNTFIISFQTFLCTT